jgi:glucokinase
MFANSHPGQRRRAGRRPRATEDARHAAHLRRLNLERVLAVAMEQPGPFTRAEIITATGLSAPTVGSLSSDLIRTGVLRDLGTGPSSGGRRPSFMEFNARHGYVAGIDIGPTRTRLAVADLRGEVLGHRVVETPAKRGPAAVLGRIAAEVRALLREAHVPPDRLIAVGAGAPGAVDPNRGIVLALAPNLKGWSQVPMAATLRRALGSSVVVENDVNLAIMGERWRGAARGHETCAFITVGTGIGAGIIVKGELHHGHHFLAGEIALMCMGPQYVSTDFGSRGCLETLAGLKAVSGRWSPPPSGGDGSRSVEQLFAAAKAGDSRARQIAGETATLLAIATANLSVVLDPSLIVLGGAVITQAPAIVEEIRRIVSRIVPSPPTIVLSDLHEEAPLWGSLLVAMTEAREQLRQQLHRPRAASP